MPKLLIYGIGSFISILVMTFVIGFLLDINRVPVSQHPLQEDEQLQEVNQSVKKAKWLGRLDKDKQEDYYFPVTEISINLDLEQDVDSKYRNRSRYFKLITQSLNNYHYFCLKQVLDQSRIKHKIERYNNDIAVILYSQNGKVLNSIVKELNKYDIQSSVKEIRK